MTFCLSAWHTLVQGTFTIGVACSIVGLGFLTHCAQGMIIKMSPITHRTTVSILAIAGNVCNDKGSLLDDLFSHVNFCAVQIIKNL